MRPVLHLSLPVDDLAEDGRFYALLGCEVGRTRPDFMDVWFYGLQLTLQHRPDRGDADAMVADGRHFGVTLGEREFRAAVRVLESQDLRWISPVTRTGEGTPLEQTKLKVADPGGNILELETYPDPSAALQHELPEE